MLHKNCICNIVNIDSPGVVVQCALKRNPSQTFLQAPQQNQASQAGLLQIADFQNPAGLRALGSNLFQPTEASGDPVVGTPGGQEGMGALRQGMLEGSNVSIVEEFIHMITSQRAYEANSRVVRAADEMLQEANSLTR